MISIRAYYVLFLLLVVTGCAGGAKETMFDGQKVLGNKYISFVPPQGWYTLFSEKPWIIDSNVKAQRVELDNDSFKGATYQIEVEVWPFKWKPYKGYFDKNIKYKMVLKNEDMHLDENDKEQGIGYYRQWVSYIQGLKCTEGVFSRSPVGMMKGMSSKNYSFACGYYDKAEGKRILTVSYSYIYAGGSTRHQKDANTPQDELISLEQAELGLKKAVKQLVSTIKIKNMDRERMKRKGLLHPDKTYEISLY